MLPQSGIAQSSATNMLAMGNPPFMQNPPHLGQPQGIGGPQPMASNPPMGILTGGPPGGPGRYIQHQPQRPNQVFRPGTGAPQLAPGAPPSASQIQNQLQNQQFPRRVQSQPQLNIGHMSDSVNMGMPIMNQPPNVPGQMRPTQHVPQQMTQQRLMQQQQMLQARNHVGNPQGLSPAMTRTSSAQQNPVMSSLPSVGSIPHPPGMQPPHLPNSFPNGGPMPPSHLPPQLNPAARPTQNQTPGMSMGTPGPSLTPMNRHRPTTDDSNMFLGYSGPHFSSGTPRVTPNPTQSNYPPFVPSSPIQMDITQSSPPNMMHPQGGASNRPPFITSPPQTYDIVMNNNSVSMDGYSSFGMPPPTNIPPRPPSHTNNPHQPPLRPPTPQQHQALQQIQQSRRLTSSSPDQTQMGMIPQRPPSQPQQMPGRPPSRSTSRTPRASHMQLPNGPLTATGRLPVAQQGGPPVPGMMSIAPRPPTATGNARAPTPSPLNPSSQSSAATGDGPSTAAPTPSRPSVSTNSSTLSLGQGLLRVLQFSGVLSSETHNKTQLSWWNDLIKEYFTPKASMKLTLWRDNQRTEAKPFVHQEIGVPILPRFFLVSTQSGVKSMALSLDGVRERHFQPGVPGHTIVECPSAVWTWKYLNGYTVSLKGPMSVRVMLVISGPPNGAQAAQYTLKFDDFSFDAVHHEKTLSVESITGRRVSDPRYIHMPENSGPVRLEDRYDLITEEERRWDEPKKNIDRATIPGEPVNAFGIPQATMRCLELAESVSAMSDLITFAGEHNLGAKEALSRFAAKLRDTQALSGDSPAAASAGSPTDGRSTSSMTLLSNPFTSYPPSVQSSVTLYSSAPPSVTNPSSTNPPSSTMSSPPNTSSQTNSPEKQNKTIPPPASQQGGQQPSSQSGSAGSPPGVSSGSTATNTPALAANTLKRKQAGSDATSPTVGNEQPAKRAPRKRVRAGTTGGAG
ncbi:hypothetical protein CPC08DRAFT_768697 [Agrocybe pediades]|nr:hypothetical protein CPC08DRAFT_768697 [Agrocybe pediades]